MHLHLQPDQLKRSQDPKANCHQESVRAPIPKSQRFYSATLPEVRRMRCVIDKASPNIRNIVHRRRT
ncbi:hypothetical protein HanRHA438_Chr04g0197961 [Helianthus annuus]|nr:hypothetical protein HanRHA438_Chr04g0197961 [Helianthus annuus]